MERFCGADLMGWTRVEMGEPWKEDLFSKKDGLRFEESLERERDVAMVAILEKINEGLVFW